MEDNADWVMHSAVRALCCSSYSKGRDREKTERAADLLVLHRSDYDVHGPVDATAARRIQGRIVTY